MIRIDRLDHLVLTVEDIPATCAFYRRVLGFDAICVDGRWALHNGRQKINLHQHGREFEPKAARATPGSGDLCFVATNDVAEIVEYLRAQRIEIEEGPVARNGAIGTMTSVYCRDPDGNLLEIATYPR